MLALTLGAVLFGYSRRPEGLREHIAMSSAAALVTVIGLGKPLADWASWRLTADEGQGILGLWFGVALAWMALFVVLERRTPARDGARRP